MPLSDLFKRSPKKKPAKAEGSQSSDVQKKQYDAAVEFLKEYQYKLPLLGGKPHPGTILSVAAHLAGTSLFRSIHKGDVTPGTVVLSEEANCRVSQTFESLCLLLQAKRFGCNVKTPANDIP